MISSERGCAALHPAALPKPLCQRRPWQFLPLVISLLGITACEDVARGDVVLSLAPASTDLWASEFCAGQDAGVPDGGEPSRCEQEFTVTGVGSRGIPAEGVRVEVSVHLGSPSTNIVVIGGNSQEDIPVKLDYAPGCSSGSEKQLSCILSQEGQARFRAHALTSLPANKVVRICADVVGEFGKRPQDDESTTRSCSVYSEVREIHTVQATLQGLDVGVEAVQPYQLACGTPPAGPCASFLRSQQFRLALTGGDRVTPAKAEGVFGARITLVPQSGSRFGDAWLSSSSCDFADNTRIEYAPVFDDSTSASTDILRFCTTGAPGHYALSAQILGDDGGTPIDSTTARIDVKPQPVALQLVGAPVPTGNNRHLITFEVRDCRGTAIPNLPFTIQGIDGGPPEVKFEATDAGPTAQAFVVSTPDAGVYPFAIAVQGSANTCPLSVQSVP